MDDLDELLNEVEASSGNVSHATFGAPKAKPYQQNNKFQTQGYNKQGQPGDEIDDILGDMNIKSSSSISSGIYG